jgi:hypothetical protein
VHKKLHKIAKINTGYSFRGSIIRQQSGGILVVQAKDIPNWSSILDLSLLTEVKNDAVPNPNFLENKDVLLISRASSAGSFRSALFNSNGKKVVASSSVYIIRVKDATVLPAYLSLYLNSPEGQKSLSQVAIGSLYLQSLLVKTLSEIEIPVPPIHIQKNIIALCENFFEQQKIVKRKAKIQENIINASFANLINK